MAQNPYIEFTYSKYLSFKKAYLRALEYKLPEFEFEGNEISTDYARHVVELLDNRFKHINESEKE